MHSLNGTKVDSLAQQVEHIPFKDGVLGSSPRRITETARRSKALSLVFLYTHSNTDNKNKDTLPLTDCKREYPKGEGVRENNYPPT